MIEKHTKLLRCLKNFKTKKCLIRSINGISSNIQVKKNNRRVIWKVQLVSSVKPVLIDPMLMVIESRWSLLSWKVAIGGYSFSDLQWPTIFNGYRAHLSLATAIASCHSRALKEGCLYGY